MNRYSRQRAATTKTVRSFIPLGITTAMNRKVLVFLESDREKAYQLRSDILMVHKKEGHKEPRIDMLRMEDNLAFCGYYGVLSSIAFLAFRNGKLIKSEEGMQKYYGN